MSDILEPQSLRERLAHLGTLQQGWLGDDDGCPLDAGYLLHVGDVLSRLMTEHGVPRPYCYPTPDGLVECEWDGVEDGEFFSVTFNANRSVDVMSHDHESHCAYVTDDNAVDFLAEQAATVKLDSR